MKKGKKKWRSVVFTGGIFKTKNKKVIKLMNLIIKSYESTSK